MNSVMTKQFYKQRSDFEKSCVTRDEKLTFPDGVDFTENIAYADDNEKAHRLDIFRPQNAKDTMLPVIINVHGGGLLLGIKSLTDIFVPCFARKDFLYTV